MSNTMFNFIETSRYRLLSMGRDYARMMAAAQKLLGLNNQADVARAIGQYDQMLTNWKSRGIPSKELLNISKIIGCDPFWLRDGEGEMMRIELSSDDVKAIEINRSLRVAQRQAWYHVGHTIAKPDDGTNGKQ